MRMHDLSEPTLGNANNQARSFTMKASVKAFKVLSSSIYTEKVRAIIRELSTNCTDAHILAGHTDPFDIKLPTQLDPRFIIRDYGPGLSDDQVQNMYTIYFESTKEDSNDFTGALGLGSKSPFCYTETFSVVSRYQGTKSLYTIYMDGGEPKILPSGSWPMEEDERTGLEITVPTKPEDTSEWTQEAMRMLRPFSDIKPNVTPNIPIDFFDHTVDSWRVKNSDNWDGSGHFAIMGRIVYPIPDEVLKGTWAHTLPGTTYIRFDLGELDIAASRESLSLDPLTRANIAARLKEHNRVETEQVIERFNNIKTKREFLAAYNSYSYSSQAWIRANIKHDGLSVEDVKTWLNNTDRFNGLEGYHLDPVASRMGRKVYKETRQAGSVIRTSGVFGAGSTGLVIIIEDVKGIRGKANRAIATFDDCRYKYAVHFDISAKDVPAQWLAYVDSKIADIQSHFEGACTVVRFSDERVKNKVKEMHVTYAGSSGPRPTSPNAILFKKDRSTEQLFLTAQEAREIDGYVLFKHRDDLCLLEGQMISGVGETCIADYLNKFNLADDLYIVRPSIVKNVRKSPDAICAVTAINEKMIELAEEIDDDQFGFTDTNRVFDRIKACKGLNPLAEKIIRPENSTKVSPSFELLHTWRRVKASSGLNLDWHKHYDEQQQAMNKNFADCIAKFKEKNQLVYNYISDNYYFNDQKVIEDILRVVR